MTKSVSMSMSITTSLLLLHHRRHHCIGTFSTPSFILGLRLEDTIGSLWSRHPLEVTKNLFRSCLYVFEQKSSGGVIEWIVAELTSYSVIRTVFASVEIFTREALVEIKTLISL